MDLSASPLRKFSSDRGIKAFVVRNKKPLLIAAALLFLFYWFQVRPVRINATCHAQASGSARVLLQQKAEAATDADTRESYESLVEKGMYLRSDYESYYKKCLRSYGIFTV